MIPAVTIFLFSQILLVSGVECFTVRILDITSLTNNMSTYNIYIHVTVQTTIIYYLFIFGFHMPGMRFVFCDPKSE